MSYTNSPTLSTSKMPQDVAYVERPSSEIDIDPAEEKALVRKIDLFLLPTIWLMYLLSYMDRTNIGNAKIAGLQADLKLSSSQYSIALVVFFVFYVVCEIPSNIVLSRARPSVFLPVIMFLWGGVTVGMAFVKDYHHLVALRCVVGVLEAGFAPGVLLILSSWYKRAEQSKRFAVYISAAILSGAFGGLLAGAITKGLDGAHGLRGWRWLFIVEGVATSCWSVIAHFILPDFPSNSSRKFTEREIQVAIARLRADDVSSNSAGSERLSHKAAFAHCFKNWRVILFTLGYMVIVGSSTLSYFYPTLVQGLGYSAHMAQYMTVPIYLVAFVATALTGYFSDKVPNFRGLIISVWLTFALVCAIAVTVLTNFTARYVLLVFMAAALWATNGLSLSYCSSTFGSMPLEARAIGLAFVNAMGNLAQIYGAYLFPAEEKPRYIKGFSVISAMLAFGACVYLSLHILLRKNGEGKKDREEQRI